ncbi:unnamed protein product [Diabrotica balteata]|uniref:Kinesin-like protein n=1 Tax=Diabrotica balteata TaxID=107213 RepID=A0A9N9SPX5_DIABA|nr:unnamed protein product [Diabrotica balteata]
MDPTKSKLPKKSKIPLTEVQQNMVKAAQIASATPRTTGPSQNRNIPGTATISTASNRNTHGKFLRRSRSMVNLGANPTHKRVGTESSTKPVFKNPNNVAGNIKSTLKRAATNKLETIAEPKEAKQPKIAAWDFKGKYKELQEKHKKLIETYCSLKEQCADTEEMRKNYDEIIARKDGEINDLKTRLSILETEYTNISAININITTKCNELDNENKILKNELGNSNNMCVDLETTIEKLKRDYMLNETLKRQLQNTIQDLKGNIRVFCRVRPPINEAENEKSKCWINYVNESTIEIRPTQPPNTTPKSTDPKLEFTFDQVFQESATQEEFFVELSQLVQSAIDGYNVCVFAYGQTGSGKTYTMQGSENPVHMGMIPRTINLIFDTIKDLKNCKWQYEVTASFLEIYNENVRDLLDSDTNQNLEILYNDGRGITVSNLKVEKICSFRDFEKYMKKAQKNRAVAATDVNQHSSRSHAVTKITINGKNEETNVSWTGSVNLVDLAGSESAKTNQGARLTETKNINKSLSTLQTVMLSLHNKDKHVPYRNSKLTYLLQSSLGGNSKTLMIVNISPFEETYGESINSLRFASKVKEVKTKIKKNK